MLLWIIEAFLSFLVSENPSGRDAALGVGSRWGRGHPPASASGVLGGRGSADSLTCLSLARVSVSVRGGLHHSYHQRSPSPLTGM